MVLHFQLLTFFAMRLSLVTYPQRKWGLYHQGWQLIGMYVVNVSTRSHAIKFILLTYQVIAANQAKFTVQK